MSPSFLPLARKKKTQKDKGHLLFLHKWPVVEMLQWTVSYKEKRSFQVPHMYCLVVHCVMVVTSTYSSTLTVVCWLPSNNFLMQRLVFADK